MFLPQAYYAPLFAVISALNFGLKNTPGHIEVPKPVLSSLGVVLTVVRVVRREHPPRAKGGAIATRRALCHGQESGGGGKAVCLRRASAAPPTGGCFRL